VGTDEADGFADVLNGFSLDSRRRRRTATPESPEPVVPQPQSPRPPEVSADEENASIVRAYAWTGGRTRTDASLEIETLVSATAGALDALPALTTEHQEIVELCRTSRSVAEVAALLNLPLGVIRVVLGDMADLGLVTVHENETGPDLDLLERVLRGLTNLRT
jgi:Protein of unknown function (DUF742)